MRLFLLIAAIIGFCGVGAVTFDGRLKEKLFDYRARSQNLHLDHLEEELERVEHAFEEYEKKYPLPSPDDVAHLKARVSGQEVSHCRPRHVRCGAARYKCANELTFCDGFKDCFNGFDESDAICHSKVAKVGRAYSGLVTWTSCANYEPHNVVVSILTADTIPNFASHTKVRGVIAFNHDDTPGEGAPSIHSYDVHGYYSAGKRVLALEADDNSESHLGVFCHFNLGDDDTADCKLVEKASLHTCATFRVAEV